MINLQKLAEISGVNISTVSRALNDSPRVKPETKAFIKQLACDHGYIPDDIARGLINKRTFMVGAIIPEFINTFYAEIIEGFESVFNNLGYSVFFGKTGFDSRNEIKYIDSFLRKRVDGIIACAVSDESIDYLKRKTLNIPVVLMDCFAPSNDFDSVSIDNAFGIYRVTEHFVNLGHKCFGYIGDNVVTSERIKAYKKALGKFKIPISDEYIRTGNERYEQGGYVRMKELLSLNPKPSAVFAVTDNMAIGAIHAIRESGLSIPEDISIVGFDDITVSSFLEKPLTTVLQPKFEMGRTASNLLLDRINSKEDMPVKKIIINPELIIRKTVGIRK